MTSTSSSPAEASSEAKKVNTHFTHTQDQLRQIAADVLKYARNIGATDCTVDISEGSGLSVSVRKGDVETIEQNRDKGIGVTVYLGDNGVRRGNASTSDFSQKAMFDTVNAAYNIAKYTAEDDCARLPDNDQYDRKPRDFDLFHPWNIDAEAVAELAKRAEDAAFAVSPMVRNSDGATVSLQHSHFVSANSRGFVGGYPFSRHSLSVAPIASLRARDSDGMQRDDWYVSMRDPADLPAPEAVGRYAAERALARLSATRLGTRQVPVLFEAPLACGLLGALTQALSGGALYRKSSFLLDSLNQQVLPGHIDVIDDPFVRKGMGSASFDEEGVRTRRRVVVEAGIVGGYFLSNYSARKLGLQSTGNAGGSHNLSMTSRNTQSGDNFVALLKKMGTGLLVTELMGQGVNYVTGDYSRGAVGFWVENGIIMHPVEEITIAGNMRDMLKNIVAIGADTITRGNKRTGSILIESMMVAGD